jgi:hemoglobin
MREREYPVESLYDRIGGEAAVNAAVDLFYDKVLSDYRVYRFFDNVDMPKQVLHLKAFMTVAFGGPSEYSGRSLRDGHARLVKMGLNDDHYDAVLEDLNATLLELGVAEDMINEVCALVESVRPEVLGK